MAVGHFIVKYLLFILNLIFTLIGLALVVIGVLLHFRSKNAPDNDLEVPPLLDYLSIAIIIFGCIVFLIAFAGCCGAVTETKCLLVTFAAIMVLLIAAKTYLLIVWNSEINTARYAVEESLEDIFYDPVQNVTFHVIEVWLQCCGTTGPEVYEILPPTCCGETEIDLENMVECKIEDAFSVGCIELVDQQIAIYANLLRTVLLSVIVFEALEFVGAVYLCTSINKRRTKHNNVYNRGR